MNVSPSLKLKVSSFLLLVFLSRLLLFSLPMFCVLFDFHPLFGTERLSWRAEKVAGKKADELRACLCVCSG